MNKKKLFVMSGAKNDWVVGLVFIGIFLTIVGINIFCRYRSSIWVWDDRNSVTV